MGYGEFTFEVEEGNVECNGVRIKYFKYFFFSSRRRHTRYIGDWSSDVCSSDLTGIFVWPKDFRYLVDGTAV